MTNDKLFSLKSQRPVRSYVLRQGRMTPAQTKALQELWPVYGIEKNRPVDIHSSLILEIGFGMGHSLAAQAKNHPENHYIGVEVHKPGIGSLLLQIQKEKINNIRIFCCDVMEVLKNNIPEQALDKVQIFFPDPWPKKRHQKRRLIQPDFLTLIHQKLKPGGILHIATDWEDYYTHILETIKKSLLFEIITIPHDRPPTKFEQRGKKLGHEVWDILVCKSVVKVLI
jgi:tRNA (guanine-N7-)-methyltransferase